MRDWRKRVSDEEDLYFCQRGWNSKELDMVREKAKEFILDEYEDKIEQLEKIIKDKDLEIEDLKYEVNRLIDGHPSKEGYRMMGRIMKNNYKM